MKKITRYFKNQCLFFVIISLIITSCATYNPFYKINRDEFYKSVKVIALMPIGISVEVDNLNNVTEMFTGDRAIKNSFETSIYNKLIQSGFKVVSSSVYETLWDSLAQEIGGYYDPIKGIRDSSKYNIVKEKCQVILEGKYGVNAILSPEILKVSANWYNRTAEWHGVKDKMRSKHELILSLMFGGSSSGKIPALSLEIIIKDLNGSVLYTKYGGIQILYKSKNEQWIPVPKNELLMDQEKNFKAIDISLYELINQK